MIPLREQELLQQRFARELTSRVRIDFFTQKKSPLYIPGRQECLYCDDVQAMLNELASLSPRIALSVHDFNDESSRAASLGVERLPGIVIRGQANRSLRFAGIPSGQIFPVFIDALSEAARGALLLSEDTKRQLRRLKTDIRLQVLVTTACANSPATMRTALRLALQSPRVQVEIVELMEFPQLAESFLVRSTPSLIFNERTVLPGSFDEATLLPALMRIAEGKPLPAGLHAGPVTPYTPPQSPAQQPQLRTLGSGLVLPR